MFRTRVRKKKDFERMAGFVRLIYKSDKFFIGLERKGQFRHQLKKFPDCLLGLLISIWEFIAYILGMILCFVPFVYVLMNEKQAEQYDEKKRLERQKVRNK